MKRLLSVDIFQRAELVNYDDYELTVIQQSLEQDYHTYEISVKLREDCLLKAARVYMVFELLEKMGDVIKSSPSVEKLEEEDFDEVFYIALVTTEPKDDVQKKLMKVSEVTEVVVQSVTLEQLKTRQQDELNKVEKTEQVVVQSPEKTSQTTEVKPEKNRKIFNNKREYIQ